MKRATTPDTDPRFGGGRVVKEGTVKRHHQRLERELRRRLPPGIAVNVWPWEGGDPSWGYPVYVTAGEAHAVCDLDAGTVEEQADFIVEQLEEQR